MTNKDKILEYMKRKATYCKTMLRGNRKFYFTSDYKDVIKWDEDTCKRVWEALLSMRAEEGIPDGWYCPQCIKSRSCNNKDSRKHGDISVDCDTCNYAKSHGSCLDVNSTYRTMIRSGKYSSLHYRIKCGELIEEVELLDSQIA